jgi:hypothetical protein
MVWCRGKCPLRQLDRIVVAHSPVVVGVGPVVSFDA